MLAMVSIFVVSRIFPILRNSSINKNSGQDNSNRKTGNHLIIGLPESLESYRQENVSAHQVEKPVEKAEEHIDCRLIGDRLKWWNITRNIDFKEKPAKVSLDHFEYQFGIPEFDHAKLELLNGLLAGGKQIRVLSTINPLTLDREDDPESSSPNESKRPAPVSLQEWSQVFQSFTLRYYKQDRQDNPDKEDKPEIPADSRSILADEPYYAAIWQARTLDEKITLHHLARDGFVHTENQDLRYLFDLGLITFKPNPRLLNDDFEKYVLNAA
ncbi:MAG: hypothetical protein MJA29_06115, partial [Candidatus Omnitrophica bacterium]|nr:hypothetical protein [Candidatus Omnitrophota bacterium]